MAGFGWYAGLLVASMATTLAVMVAAIRARERVGAVPLAVLLGGTTFWTACDLAGRLATDRTVQLLFGKLLYVGIVVTVAGYVVFALDFVGHEGVVTRRTVAALAVEPVVLLGALAVSPTGGPFIEQTIEGGSVTTSGPLFAAHVAYSYLLVAVATALLLRTTVRAKRLYVWQFAAILVGVVAPWLANAFYLFGLVAVDATPLAFSVTGVALFLASQRVGFMDIAPVARDIVVDTIDDAVVVVDDESRLIDYNTAFGSLFEVGDGAVGTDLSAVLTDCPDLRRVIDAGADGEVVTVELPEGERAIEVTVSTVTDESDRTRGRVALLHDVTQQQRRQRELERQNERLDQFASVVSHDLRNPLNVAVGRTELAMETGDVSHLEDVQDAHERMQQLIDDVLELARQGDSLDETEAVSLAVAAREAWDHVTTEGATLEVADDATIAADRSRLQQLFENLFRNAVEHGSTNNRPAADDTGDHAQAAVAHDVTVTVGVHDEGFYVEDDGPGIPEGERDEVFEAGHTTAEDGTGFGLAIVEQIARAHGWSVGVTDSETGGARFEFEGVQRGSS